MLLRCSRAERLISFFSAATWAFKSHCLLELGFSTCSDLRHLATDTFGTLPEAKGRERLFVIFLIGGKAYDHHRFTVTPKAVTQQMSQLAVTVGNVLFAARAGRARIQLPSAESDWLLCLPQGHARRLSFRRAHSQQDQQENLDRGVEPSRRVCVSITVTTTWERDDIAFILCSLWI